MKTLFLSSLIYTCRQTMTMDSKEVLSSLLKNELNIFQVAHECEKRKLKIGMEMDFSSKKYVLQKYLLEELLKDDSFLDKDFYARLLASTNEFLKLKQKCVDGYSCQLIGCHFRTTRHRWYLKHLDEIHPRLSSHYCMYKKSCRRNFTTIVDLRTHAQDEHFRRNCNASSTGDMVLSEECKCVMLSCGQKRFGSIKELVKHVNNFHHNETRVCVFERCDQIFNAGSVSRNHFQKKHFKLQSLTLKPACKIPGGGLQVEDADDIVQDETGCMLVAADMPEMDELCFSDEELVDAKEEDENRELQFQMAYADFLNRLTSYHHVPLKTVRIVATEYILMTKKALAVRDASLGAALSKCSNLSDECIADITAEVSKNDHCLQVMEMLVSEHRRMQFLGEHFKLVMPMEITLNPDQVKLGKAKDCIHYIPITCGLKTLLEDKTYCQVIDRERNDLKKAPLEDVKDGLAFKQNNFFIENPDAVSLLLYSDAVEVVNPIGPGKSKHKIVQVFWSSGDLSRQHRSQIDKLQLCLVFKEKLLKKYGSFKIFKCLIDDLRVLENDGLILESPVHRRIKAGVLLYSADNLEVSTNHSYLSV